MWRRCRGRLLWKPWDRSRKVGFKIIKNQKYINPRRPTARMEWNLSHWQNLRRSSTDYRRECRRNRSSCEKVKITKILKIKPKNIAFQQRQPARRDNPSSKWTKVRSLR